MCPDPQILSIYMDGELPSPWKEKMKNHLTECSVCKEKIENFKRLQELFKKDTHQKRTIVERTSAELASAERALPERELMESAKEKVWKNLVSSYRRNRQRSYNVWQNRSLWQKRFSIPLPAAAAAAVVIALLTAFWMRDGNGNNNYANYPIEPAASFILAAEEEIPGIIPASDLTSVLQYLGASGTEIIILQLPETRDFFRSGEPAMIRAADYTRRQP